MSLKHSHSCLSLLLIDVFALRLCIIRVFVIANQVVLIVLIICETHHLVAILTLQLLIWLLLVLRIRESDHVTIILDCILHRRRISKSHQVLLLLQLLQLLLFILICKLSDLGDNFCRYFWLLPLLVLLVYFWICFQTGHLFGRLIATPAEASILVSCLNSIKLLLIVFALLLLFLFFNYLIVFLSLVMVLIWYGPLLLILLLLEVLVVLLRLTCILLMIGLFDL